MELLHGPILFAWLKTKETFVGTLSHFGELPDQVIAGISQSGEAIQLFFPDLTVTCMLYLESKSGDLTRLSMAVNPIETANHMWNYTSVSTESDASSTAPFPVLLCALPFQ